MHMSMYNGLGISYTLYKWTEWTSHKSRMDAHTYVSTNRYTRTHAHTHTSIRRIGRAR